jgi:hypothetical protein
VFRYLIVTVRDVPFVPFRFKSVAFTGPASPIGSHKAVDTGDLSYIIIIKSNGHQTETKLQPKMTKIFSTSTALVALISLCGIGAQAKFCQNAAQTVEQVAFHAYEKATGDFNLFKVSPSFVKAVQRPAILFSLELYLGVRG